MRRAGAREVVAQTVVVARVERDQSLREILAESFGVSRMLQHQGALQILGTMQPAGEAEVPMEVGTGPLEEIQDRAFLRYHKCLLYH